MNARFLPFASALVFVAASYTMGCSADGTLNGLDNQIGAGAYNNDGLCSEDSDCMKGESCTNGRCLIKRCADNGFATRAGAPLRSNGFLLQDRELIVGAGSNVRGFDMRGRSLPSVASAQISAGKRVVDLVGGNFLGVRPEVIAFATEGSDSLTLKQDGNDLPALPIGFVPVALTSGDTEMDGLDRIIAAAANGDFAICNAKTSTCAKGSIGVSGITDVAAGDVDGDGYAEIVFLAGDRLIAYNYDGGKTEQKKSVASNIGRRVIRIAAGDINGDGKDELVALEDTGSRDSVHVLNYSDGNFSVRNSIEVENAADIAVGGLGGERTHVVTLGSGNMAEVLEGQENGSLRSAFRTALSSTSGANRIGFADVDNDSVPARLKDKPRVVSGSLVPMAVLVPPPYSKTYSGEAFGGSKSSITVSTSASTSEGTDESKTESEGLSMSASASIAWVNGSLSESVSNSITKSVSYSESRTVGQSFTFDVRPELDGYDTGAVILGCGCYNEYQYDVDDPKGRLGKAVENGTFSVFIPIGGQTTMWSIKRYNELAAASNGELPVIQGSPRIGDVSSYPTTPQTIDGKPIPAADLVFEDPPSFRVSDVGSVSFSFDMSKSKTDSTSTSESKSNGWSVGVNVGFTIPIINVGASVGASVSGDVSTSIGNGYSLTMGNSTSFSGSVPPIRDNPATPEDEFAIHGYSFTPYVYRAHYVTKEEQDAGYFVVTYTVGK